MQTIHRIARRVRALAENGLVLRVEKQRASAIVAGVSTVELADNERSHILIAPPGAGNIGDQAMVEAFVDNVAGPVTVVVRRAGDVREMPAPMQERVTELVLPGLLYGLPHEHLRDIRVLGEHLTTARSLSVVGADIMDGAYWESPSVRRFRLVELAARSGLDARVLGFSWNTSPSRASRAAMVATSRVADLLARDPQSVARLRRDGGQRIVPVADIALLTTARPPASARVVEWCERRRAEGKRLVLLNVNGLIEASSGMLDTFVALLDSSAAEDCAFVVVPHVSRGNPSDVELAIELEKRIGEPERLIALRELLPPGQIAGLASMAHLAVTGRMHLTVLSTSVGTPVVTVGYQGKVAGLYDLIGTSTFIDGGESARVGLLTMIERALAELPGLTSDVEQALPRLTDLARRNVEGLGRP